MTREELEAVQAQVVALRAELEAHQDSSKADLEAATGKLAAEISNLQVVSHYSPYPLCGWLICYFTH